MSSNRTKAPCPFCDGDGCCFCDYEGSIYIGPKEMIKTEEGLNSIGVKYLQEADRENGGGLENWPEMWEHFLKEENVPKDFKLKHNHV